MTEPYEAALEDTTWADREDVRQFNCPKCGFVLALVETDRNERPKIYCECGTRIT